MKRRLRVKPNGKEIVEVFITGMAVGIIGFIIASIMSVRFHSLENDQNYINSLKKTEMFSTQISQN
jgi:hypothetical protein